QLRATAAAFQRLRPEIVGEALEQALEDLIERFRAYRTYSGTPSPQFDMAYEHARAERPSAALDAIADVMHSESDDAHDPARRFNQLAAPVAAKAVEDTAFYRYGRLLSRNDVGFSPENFSLAPEAFLSKAMDRD